MPLVSIDWRPAERRVRQFGLLGGFLFLAVAGWDAYRNGMSTTAAAFAMLAAVFVVGGLAWPRAFRFVYIGMMVASYPVGWVMSHLLLFVIYFGVFTPLGLVFRLLGRDPLQLRPEPNATTYWRPKSTPDDPKRYLQQF
jgi:Saxitoxin biosynthesis operon protein SxtJ